MLLGRNLGMGVAQTIFELLYALAHGLNLFVKLLCVGQDEPNTGVSAAVVVDGGVDEPAAFPPGQSTFRTDFCAASLPT